jgi:PAS domain S-box-containing protein
MNSDKPNTALLHHASRYALAVGAVALGSLLRYGFDVWVGPDLPTYITFYPAVMLAALLGGFGPGLLATVLAAAVADYLLLPPLGLGIASFRDAVGVGLFLLMGVFMSAVAELYRRARIKAAVYDQEVALREINQQKNFLADVLQRSSQPFAVGYPDGRLGLINSAFEQLTGYTRDELKSIDWINGLTPPEWRDIEQEKLEALRRTGQPVRYEKEYLRKDGTRAPIELLTHLMTDADGNPEYYYSFLTDITERKQLAEAQLFLLQCGYKSLDEDFFESLARYLAEKLHMYYVCIDQLQVDCLTAKTVVIYCDGEFEDNVEYTLKDTPCSEVVGKTICCFPKDVCRLFPRDVVLQEMHAESYVGTTLWSSRGEPIGLIAVIGRQQLSNPGLAEAILKLVAIRAAGELERRQVAEALRERVKELTCLYVIADLIEKEDSLEKTLQGSADVMPNAWFYPEVACARIIFEGRQYQTGNFRETDWRQSADLKLNGQPVGMVELCYLEKRPIRDEGPFLKEERNLINAIAERLGMVAERRQAEEKIKHNADRMGSLLRISQYQTESIKDLLDYALSEAISLTRSTIGYFYFYDDEKKQFTLNTWSKQVMKECTIMEQQTLYALDKTGIWGEAVRQAKSIIVNDFQAAHPLKKGYPEGHAELYKFITVPVFSGGRIVAVVGVANKPTDYDEADVQQLTLMMDVVWKIVENKQAQDALSKSRDELELRVQERTAMLQKVNELLREEMEDRRRIEIVVRESEARFRSLIHTAPVVIVSLAPDGTILEFNPEAELAYGRTRAEVLGRNYLDLFIPAEQYDMVTDAMKRVLAGEPISSYENPIRGADGSEQFYIWNIDRVIDDKGEPCAIIAVGHDVTERRKMLEALEAAAAYTRSIIEASLDPLVTINQDGKVTDLNRATEQIVNLPREQIIGNDFSDYFTEPEKARKVFQHVFKRGFVRDYPLAIKGRFGVVRDVLYNATVYRNRAGEIEGVFAAARDVTKRKRAEERLRESEERLKFLSSRLLEVQEHERKSIAADLHDSVASSLTAVILGLSRARPAIEVSDPKYRDIFNSSISMLQSAIDETRQLMNALRPPMLDDFGLISSIRWFTEQYRALYPQLTTDTEITIEENLIPAHLKIVLFRIIQEAFTNIAKHSRAQAASLYLKQKENTIDLVIADDGAGFDQEAVSSKQEPNRGLGIMSMQERTELSGGNLVIESARGQGTILSASWPMRP